MEGRAESELEQWYLAEDKDGGSIADGGGCIGG